MKQKVMIICAYAVDPSLYIVDELLDLDLLRLQIDSCIGR